MNKHRITLLGSHDARLREWLEGDPEGNERGAIVLLRKFDRAVHDQKTSIRFVVVDVIEMTDDWVIESTTTRLPVRFGNPALDRSLRPGQAWGFAWAQRTYTNFLSKHTVGNPSKTAELFQRIGPGIPHPSDAAKFKRAVSFNFSAGAVTAVHRCSG